ncbi:hypothetical protein SISNIDRAFT_489074 [Sistotremastrum niveocremeum HHB9708]|uniref:Uncharacterized protein n=1 Tax=Sistotremastrum niveocremeum HHB9708 TaxID=1314777 RepID=A0A164QH01_9AGAM|nr:hypothetical protein SISNIDRAFT_489074 [Sistotremastrum niveocremeum HHB9708]
MRIAMRPTPSHSPSFILLLLSFFILFTSITVSVNAQSVPTNATNLPVGSCTPDIPCSNESCCNGKTGFCGFGPDFCTPVASGGVCTSNCGALAECGPFAAPENITCPLNVCCGQFGYCGTTDEFCGTGCQSNCGGPPIPSCGADQQSATARRIGYYEGWAVTRSCMSYPPEQISATSLTHVNFAFALISNDFEVIAMDDGDQALWLRTTNLKANAPALKVFLSIGGWSFNDPPTQGIFSALVASSANTQTFIRSVLSTLETYAFDGIDIDWEYPAAYDRGGVPADKENYVTFMAAVKAAFEPHGYGLTFTAPSSYWYLQHFDLPNLLKSADWVNVMTYDLHGTWDGIDPYIGYVLGAHTNLTEIDQAFQLFWRVGVQPSQMVFPSPPPPPPPSNANPHHKIQVMGMGFYGRSFTLADPSCTEPPCPWVSGGNPGPCSDNSGTLMFSEIETVLLDPTANAVYDEVAAVKYVTWDSNQWVSYDDAESFAAKMNYANDRCIGGTMIWSVDQDDTQYNALADLYPDITAAQGSVESGDQCSITACGATSCGFGEVCTADNVQDLEAQCPHTCPLGEAKAYCCVEPPPYQNCKWVGTPPTCLDNACAVGQIQLLVDPQGDASQPCGGTGSRSYCCDAAGSDFLPVPFEDVFPSGTPQGSESFTVNLDEDVEDVGDAPSGDESSSEWGGSDDGTEEDEPFGEVFIDSPNAGSVSSMALETNWVITNCSASSDQPQQVLAYCSKSMDASGCAHVFIGNVTHTIIKMPRSCGRGPYARIDTLEPHPNQNVLTASHAAQKPADEQVFLLKFDYNFATIPESNGPVYMRADVTDLPDYWDTVVDSPPERKRWLQERGEWKEKRWWGAFTGWLSKLNTVKTKSTTTRTFKWSDRYTIFSQSESCPGPPAIESNLDITVAGSAALNTRYGFYLQGQIVPPKVSAAYLFFSSDANAQATFTILGQASVSYDSSVVQLASFGFPGLYYPGILTIGPSLVLEGWISGSLSIGGSYEASVGYTFPKTEFTLGQSSSDEIATIVTPTLPPVQSAFPSINWEVDLHGGLEMHLRPRVQLGISILGGTILDAEAFVRADLYGGMSISGSVSNSEAAQFCINPYFGVNFEAGVTGSIAFWEAQPTVWTLYQNQYNYPENGYCLSSENEGVVNSNRRRSFNSTIFEPELPPGHVPMDHIIDDFTHGHAAHILQNYQGVEKRITPREGLSHGLASSHHQKRGGVPFLPGNLFCPAVGEQINAADGGTATDYNPYSDISSNPLLDAYERKKKRSVGVSSLFHPQELRSVTVNTCSSSSRRIDINAPAYDNTNPIGYFDLASPFGTNPITATYSIDFTGKQSANAPASGYGREHVYELQLLSLFIDNLATAEHDLWTPAVGTGSTSFCTWASNYLTNSPSPYFTSAQNQGFSVVEALERCLPANTAGNTALAQPAGGEMVWLESIANGAKASSLAGITIRADNTFRSYTPTKMLSVIRGVAGAMSYMNSGQARAQFLAGHQCVDSVWFEWYEGYNNDANVNAPNKGNVDWAGTGINIYTDWIETQLEDMHLNIVDALNDFKGLFPDPSNVVLNYAGELTGVAQPGTPATVTQADIQTIINAVNPIGWIDEVTDL